LVHRATQQWFISMESHGLRKKALKAIDDTKFYPNKGKERLKSMIETRPDWCVSRQRVWGVPIPVFISKKTNEILIDNEVTENIAKIFEKEGADCWFAGDTQRFLGEKYKSEDYDKLTDIVEVWFDSGSTHAYVLEKREDLKWPASMYLEGSDQHRGWFQSSLITSCAINGRAPYRQVLTHGFTVDQNGHKMSKSLGNVIPPQKVVNSLGADILRLWIGSTDYSGEMTVSDEILKRSADSYRRIRNTMRFMLANMQGFDPNKDLLSIDKMLVLDQWIVSKTADLQSQVVNEYDEYNFHLAMKMILNFCTNDLGGFYLDIIKDRQYTTQADSLARRSAQSALYQIAHAMVRWMAPVLSFTAEEVWQYLPGASNESVFLQTWHEDLVGDFNSSAIDVARDVNVHLRNELEEMRHDKVIGSSLDAEVDIYCNDENYQALGELKDELRFVFITSDARIHLLSEKPKEATDIDKSLAIMVIKSSHQKCVRCWHHREEIGENEAHKDLCGRCIENVAGKGETRVFA